MASVFRMTCDDGFDYYVSFTNERTALAATPKLVNALNGMGLTGSVRILDINYQTFIDLTLFGERIQLASFYAYKVNHKQGL